MVNGATYHYTTHTHTHTQKKNEIRKIEIFFFYNFRLFNGRKEFLCSVTVSLDGGQNALRASAGDAAHAASVSVQHVRHHGDSLCLEAPEAGEDEGVERVLVEEGSGKHLHHTCPGLLLGSDVTRSTSRSGGGGGGGGGGRGIFLAPKQAQCLLDNFERLILCGVHVGKDLSRVRVCLCRFARLQLLKELFLGQTWT